MTSWRKVDKDRYIELCELGLITPMHQKYYQRILQEITEELKRKWQNKEFEEEEFTPTDIERFCKRCRNNFLHKHIICRKCNRLRFGEYAECKCFEEKGFNASTEPIWSTEAQQQKEAEVKDAVFITGKVMKTASLTSASFSCSA